MPLMFRPDVALFWTTPRTLVPMTELIATAPVPVPALVIVPMLLREPVAKVSVPVPALARTRLLVPVTPPEKVLAIAGSDAVQPVPIRAHEIPKRHPTSLGNREGANLLCLNVYTSRSRIARGSVAAVQVWTLDSSGTAAPLGKAPVETDGSFFVQTPADRAIRFELLNAAGKTVEAEKGWFWAKRGEQRVCVGCHAGPERAPENAVPHILLRSTEPTPLMPRPASAAGGSK